MRVTRRSMGVFVVLKKECIAMLLAGGQGSRLGALTREIAKPAVSFGGKYRIIDFSLSNCVNSQIDTVGIMTQYQPLLLNSYIGTGAAWDLDIPDGGVTILPPYATSSALRWYQGTADAVYQNINYIERYNPEYVLILSGDHLYRMDYSKMLREHQKHQADLTISAIQVSTEEASRFGILSTDETGRIVKFQEKPEKPEGTMASMGIYVFNWPLLRRVLQEDHEDAGSSHDFGKNIIPKLLAEGARLFTYGFQGYWKDIGTFESFYQANMELLDPNSGFDLFTNMEERILSNINNHAPAYLGPNASVEDSVLCVGSEIYGTVRHSIVGIDVTIAEGAVVEASVLLPGVQVGKNAHLVRAIVSENKIIGEDVSLGQKESEVTVVGDDLYCVSERRTQNWKK